MNTNFPVRAGRSIFLSLAILVGLALFNSSIFAAPPNAPVFIGNYSLDDATRGLPFRIDTPIPPAIAREQNVTPSTLGSYIGTPGLRLVLEPGTYGNQNFNSQDQEIIIQEGVMLGNVSIGSSARRLIIKADPPRSGNMTLISMPEAGPYPEDILIDGVRSDNGGNRNFVHGNRIAYLNSFIRTVDYALSGFFSSSNVIIANCDLQSYGNVQAGSRFQSVDRMAFVDNRVRRLSTETTAHHPARWHASDGDVLFMAVRRNQFEGSRLSINPPGSGDPTPYVFDQVWFEDNTIYSTIPIGALLETRRDFPNHDPLALPFLYARNNRGYSDNALRWVTGTEPGWELENNSIDVYVEPPVWNFR